MNLSRQANLAALSDDLFEICRSMLKLQGGLGRHASGLSLDESISAIGILIGYRDCVTQLAFTLLLPETAVLI
jgi:hypothetical protein